MPTATHAAPSATIAVNNLVPFAHVENVDASLAFYAHLGFVPATVLKEPSGRAYWARAKSDKADIMFARASGPIDSDQQAVLFYMYSNNVAALRTHLLASGLQDAAKTPGNARSVVFDIKRPDYMPAGELRIHDPDGYVILVGQLG